MEEYEKPRSQIRRFVYAGFDTLYIVWVHAAYRRRSSTNYTYTASQDCEDVKRFKHSGLREQEC